TSYTDGEGKVTTLSYSATQASVSASANATLLSTTDTQTTTQTFSLNYAALSTTDQSTRPATQTVSGTGQTTIASDPPIQPYPYLASAKQDTAATVTQNVTVSAQNQSVGQSSNVQNFAYYRSGATLTTGAGISLAVGSVPPGSATGCTTGTFSQ